MAVVLAAMLAISLPSAYLGGYFALGKRVTECHYVLVDYREFPNSWLVVIYEPAARWEGCRIRVHRPARPVTWEQAIREAQLVRTHRTGVQATE
jgi:hypothetical protein